MQALIPGKLKIISSNVPENEAYEWSADVTYAKGDLVIDDHYIFESIIDDNSNKRPSEESGPEGAPWREKSITNRWACIDWLRHTQTKAPEGENYLVIEVPFKRPSTGFGLLNMSGATSVTVAIAGPEGEVRWVGESINLLENPASIWNYCFDPFRYTKDLSITNLPPFSGTLKIELYGPLPAIGTIVVGEVVQLGETQYGASFPFKDYSISKFDEYGNPYYVERKKAKLGSFPVLIAKNDIDYVQQRIMEIGSRPTLWIGDDGAGFQSMIIFGRLKEYSPSYTIYSDGDATFEIEGFT